MKLYFQTIDFLPSLALQATGRSAGIFPVCVSVPVARASAWAFGFYGKMKVGMSPTRGDDHVVPYCRGHGHPHP